jgi:hypothetical protein
MTHVTWKECPEARGTRSGEVNRLGGPSADRELEEAAVMKRQLLTLVVALVIVLCLGTSVLGETFVIKESGLILEAVSVVPLGGRVLSGNTAGVSGVGTFALYYTGYDRERSVITLRSKWAFGGAALTNPAVMG